jgi:hypothetical protein
MQTLLQTYYSNLDSEVRGNILFVYWDGKETVRSLRDLNRIVQPENPIYHPKDNPEGDITEDDEGVVTESVSGLGE